MEVGRLKGRRRGIFGATTAGLGLLFVVMGTNAAGAGPSAALDRDLSHYVIFATDQFHSKGTNAATPTKTKFLGGSVGVNEPGDDNGTPTTTTSTWTTTHS